MFDPAGEYWKSSGNSTTPGSLGGAAVGRARRGLLELAEAAAEDAAEPASIEAGGVVSSADAGGRKGGSLVAGVEVTASGRAGGGMGGRAIGSAVIVAEVVAIPGCSHAGATVSRSTRMPTRTAPVTSVVVMTMRKAVGGGGFGGYLLGAGTRTGKIILEAGACGDRSWTGGVKQRTRPGRGGQ